MDEDGVIFLGALYGRDRFGSILGMAWNKIAAKNQITNFERNRNTYTKCIWKSQIRKLETIHDLWS